MSPILVANGDDVTQSPTFFAELFKKNPDSCSINLGKQRAIGLPLQKHPVALLLPQYLNASQVLLLTVALRKKKTPVGHACLLIR
jgi:hypothetical protein